MLLALPDNREVTQVSAWLAAEGYDFLVAGSVPSAIRELQSRRFDVVIADAAFARDGRLHGFGRATNSRIQVIVVGERSAGDRGEAFNLARPVDHAMLLCHVTMALVEARPVRRSPRKALSRFEAVAEGMRAFLVDVSKDGLRLELPRGRTGTLPPQFTVRVPLVGVVVPVHRVWMGNVPGVDGATWCGATLQHAPGRAERNWQTFVDTVPAR